MLPFQGGGAIALLGSRGGMRCVQARLQRPAVRLQLRARRCQCIPALLRPQQLPPQVCFSLQRRDNFVSSLEGKHARHTAAACTALPQAS